MRPHDRLAAVDRRPYPRIVALSLAPLACNSLVDHDAASTTTTPDTTTTSSDRPSTPATTTTTTSDDDTPVAELDSGFIHESDVERRGDCDIWAQDCPAGEKCMAWASDGGTSWDSTHCSPVVSDPDAIGEPCTVLDSLMSGVDTCDYGAVCWNPDRDTLLGTCRAICHGSEAHHYCPPGSSCSIAGEGTAIACVPYCDPLADDCRELEACYPIGEAFACSPDASGDAGAFGDACEYVNVCDAGLFCANPEVVPGCGPTVGCCNAFCDVSTGDPCPAAGQECVPWFEPGASPSGLDHVGACVLP
jgi:hypothetical protein